MFLNSLNINLLNQILIFKKKKKKTNVGYQGDLMCSFRRSKLESRDHIFFRCSLSERIWKGVLRRCLIKKEDWRLDS